MTLETVDTTPDGAQLGRSALFAFKTPRDAYELAEGGNAACGHAALAAAMGKDVLQVMRPFIEQGEGLWVSQTRMIRAIAKLGMMAIYQINEPWPATPSVILIQGIGTWMNQGVPIGARNQRTHWVATARDEAGNQWVYDINCDGWLEKQAWETCVLPEILESWKAKTWEVRAAYQLKANNQTEARDQ